MQMCIKKNVKKCHIENLWLVCNITLYKWFSGIFAHSGIANALVIFSFFIYFLFSNGLFKIHCLFYESECFFLFLFRHVNELKKNLMIRKDLLCVCV